MVRPSWVRIILYISLWRHERIQKHLPHHSPSRLEEQNQWRNTEALIGSPVKDGNLHVYIDKNSAESFFDYQCTAALPADSGRIADTLWVSSDWPGRLWDSSKLPSQTGRKPESIIEYPVFTKRLHTVDRSWVVLHFTTTL